MTSVVEDVLLAVSGVGRMTHGSPQSMDLRIGRLHSNRIWNRLGRLSDGGNFYFTYSINLCNAVVQAYRMSYVTLRELRVVFVML